MHAKAARSANRGTRLFLAQLLARGEHRTIRDLPGHLAACRSGCGARSTGPLSRRRTLLGIVGAGTAAAAAAFAGAAPAIAATTTATKRKADLYVSGNQIMAAGVKADLRGVSMGDPLFRQHRPTSDYATLVEGWKAKLVRISVLPGSFKHQRELALELLCRDVDAALAAGLYVIVVWHAIGIPNGHHFRPPEAWGHPWDVYDSNFDLAQAFWGAVGQRYGGDGRVVFELWNEAVHSDSGKVGARPWKELKRYYVRLLGTVRQHGNNVALCGGLKWSRDLNGIKMNPIADANTGYCWHVYPGQDKGSHRALDRRLDGLPKNRPVVVTEWGFDADPELKDGGFHATPDGYPKMMTTRYLPQMAGWVAWCWQPAWGPSLVRPDWTTPTAAGTYFKELLGQPA